MEKVQSLVRQREKLLCRLESEAEDRHPRIMQGGSYAVCILHVMYTFGCVYVHKRVGTGYTNRGRGMSRRRRNVARR